MNATSFLAVLDKDWLEFSLQDFDSWFEITTVSGEV